MTPAPQQLDIFEHSQEVMRRNDVIDALLRHDAASAVAACQMLAADCPSDRDLPAMRLLAEALQQRSDTPLASPDDVARERQRVTDEIAPAAGRAFNVRDAASFMQPWWRLLAARCGGMPFQASHADDHAAAFWLRAEDWAAVVHAVERIESWRRIPTPLAWMVEARCRLGELDGYWPLLAELAWLSPRRFDAVVRNAHDPLLTRLHKKFGASFDGLGEIDDLAWFPAWVLIDTPALVTQIGLAWKSQNTPAERGMRLMVELLGLERQGRHADLVASRRSLRDLSPPLYDAYMATRR